LLKNGARVCVNLINVIRFIGDESDVVPTDKAWYNKRLRVNLICKRRLMRCYQFANSRRGQDCFLLLPAGSKVVIVPGQDRSIGRRRCSYGLNRTKHERQTQRIDQ
jgi:hypothetical protein